MTMMKAASIPPARAELALEAAGTFEAQAAELLELSRILRDEVEFAGELPTGFVKRLESLISEQKKTLAELVAATRN